MGEGDQQLVLPFSWDALSEMQRSEWLSNFSYILPDGTVFQWNDLPTLARVDFVAKGSTDQLIAGQTIRLSDLRIKSYIDSKTITTRTSATVNSQGIVTNYVENTWDNGLVSNTTWSSGSIDGRGRALSTDQVTDGSTGEITESKRDGIEYDLHSRVLGYHEIDTTNATDVTTEQTVLMKYDAQGRMSDEDRYIKEEGAGLDYESTTLLRNIQYNEFDQQTSYDQIGYNELSEFRSAEQIISGTICSIATARRFCLKTSATKFFLGQPITDQVVTVTDMRGLTYNTRGQQSGFVDFQTQAATVADATNGSTILQTAQVTVRANAQYYETGTQGGLLSSYDEVATQKGSALDTQTLTHAIQYNLNQRTSEAMQTENVSVVPGFQVDQTQQIFRHDIDYNRAGLQDSSIEDTMDNGLLVTTLTQDLAFDDRGRATETETTVFTEGETVSSAYLLGGEEPSPEVLAALLENQATLQNNPTLSLDDLVAQGLLSSTDSQPHLVNEVTVTHLTNIVYDELDRQVAYQRRNQVARRTSHFHGHQSNHVRLLGTPTRIRCQQPVGWNKHRILFRRCRTHAR